MLSILMRHYRRFIAFSFGMALFCVSTALGYGAEPSHLNIFFIFIVALVGFALVGVALYAARPRQRGVLEIAAFAGVLSALILFYIPTHGILPALLGLALFFAFFTGTWFFLQSDAALHMGQRFTWTDRHSGPLDFPAKLVWKHIVPGAAAPSDHCTGIMEHYAKDDEDPDTIKVTFKARGDRQASYLLTFLERTPPHVCRFFFQGEEADGTVVDGILAIHITAVDENTSFVAANEERRGLSLGAMIERWFDDALGYQYDRMRHLLKTRYVDAQTYQKSIADLDDD